MKLSTAFEAIAYKRLASVDLGQQHELNGVAALKSFFGTSGATRGTITWVHFRDAGDPVVEESDFKFYDAREKRAAATGRSEWRLYYQGDFLRQANVGDTLIFGRTPKQRTMGLLFSQYSNELAVASSAFGIALDRDSGYLPRTALEQRELDKSASARITDWIAENAAGVSSKTTVQALPFRPRARILILLGEQLIRDTGIAIFELVKNAYDADATRVNVTLHDITDPPRASVIVEDDGCGMSLDTIVNVWLEPGTDYRQQQKAIGYRTPLFHRLPLGEKGVGRFAAHKIGKRISVISRQKDLPEVLVEIDWNVFATERYLADATVNVSERTPEHFTDSKTGTRMEISELNEELSRGTVRQIYRSINSVCSPFQGPSEFVAELEVTPDSDMLEGLLDISSVLDVAPYRGSCLIDGNVLKYEYQFIPPPGMERIAERKISKEMPLQHDDLLETVELEEKVGPIKIEFRIFDLDAQVLDYSVSDKSGFKSFLRNNGGVRVYRDGVRVYDYGEPGNDWLDLGGSRVNRPTARVSNNQIIGAVQLNGSRSAGLVEKTNREGFIEDRTYHLFRKAIGYALTQILFERNLDKERLRLIYSSKRFRQPVLEELAELRGAVEKLPEGSAELLPMIDRVEEQYLEMRETLMTAAGAGLTLSVVIHEVEKAIKGLSVAVQRRASQEELSNLATHLNELIEGLTYLTRKSGRQNESFGNLVRQTLLNTNYRLNAHNISVTDGIIAGDPNLTVRCTRRLIIATLMNLIDNSIYWLSTAGAKSKRIYIGSSENIPGGPVLFVADNGPGFQDDPHALIQPFMSRRPEGMGLGLHIADSVMKVHDGKLVFPESAELGISDIYTGAIVGLQFKPPA